MTATQPRPLTTTTPVLDELFAIPRQHQTYVRLTIDQLVKVGVPVPEPVVTLAERLTALQQAGKGINPEGLRDDLARRIAQGHKATTADYSAITAAEERKRTTELALVHAHELLRLALHEQADTITRTIERDLVAPAFAALRDIAGRTEDGDTTTTLLRAERTTDATDLAGAGAHAGNLARASQARSTLYSGGLSAPSPGRGLTGPTAMWKHDTKPTSWINEGDTKLPTSTPDPELWLSALRAGPEPWFPTKAEAVAYEAAQQKARDDQAESGSRDAIKREYGHRGSLV